MRIWRVSTQLQYRVAHNRALVGGERVAHAAEPLQLITHPAVNSGTAFLR